MGYDDFDKNLRRLKRAKQDHVNYVIDRYAAELEQEEPL